MAIELITLTASISIILIALVILEIDNDSNDLFIAIHYALLQTLIIIGFDCIIFGLIGASITLSKINLLHFCLVIPLLGGALLIKRLRASNQIKSKSISGSSAPLFFLSYASGVGAGLVFFSVDLLPSSMTGDPARHFLVIANIANEGISQVPKPVYYLSAQLFVRLLSGFPMDEAFVIFNILSLGLCTSSCLLLFSRLLPAATFRYYILAASLICFGYPLFALIYGYYTLLLCSSFLFSAMALLAEKINTYGKKKYFKPALLIVGINLTHSFLTPDALLILIFFAAWFAHRRKLSITDEFLILSPFIFLIIITAIIANQAVGLSSVESYRKITVLAGYVNESFYLNIAPLFPFAFLYLLRKSDDDLAQILIVFICATLTFSFLMGGLRQFGFVSPYYINRNQLIILPLLIIANLGFLRSLELKHLGILGIAQAVILIFIFFPYIWLQSDPLSSRATNFRTLLENDSLVYFENAVISKSSPLQMTASDRNLMRRISKEENFCFDLKPVNIAAIGTDHEVNWFYIYTGIYPSLFHRTDMFVDFKNYLLNYQLWKSNTENEYIVVLDHFDYWRRNEILADIRSRASLTCKGESFEIYKKNLLF